MLESLIAVAANYGEVVSRNQNPPLVLASASSAVLDQIARASDIIRACPQVEVVTEHLLHGGMYARTVRREAGIIAVGSTILRATILIVNGSCSLVGGNGDRIDLTGYNVLPGLPGRKSCSLTHGPVEMTMIFPTAARTIEEAENEIFAEADDLISRKDGSKDRITITGE